MKIEKIRIDKLKPHPKNPKLHAVDKITDSIKEFGYVEPIIIDEKNQILAGHGRVKALKKLGITEAEVIRKSGLTEKQKEKYILMSNKLVELGGWDFDLLKNFGADLLEGVGFDNLDEIFPAVKNQKELFLKEIYEVIIECKDEIEQKKIYNKIKGMNYKCRILTS